MMEIIVHQLEVYHKSDEDVALLPPYSGGIVPDFIHKLTDEQLRWLDDAAYSEGVRRGFGSYWNE